MAEPLFRGVGVALVTLFRDDGTLDARATAAHAACLVDIGVRAMVIVGTTGEASTLAPEEREELLAAVRQAIPPTTRVPVLAGTGAPSARLRFGGRFRAPARDPLALDAEPLHEAPERVRVELQ